MQIDRDRIQAVLKSEHSYYGGDDIPIREDRRWKPYWQNMIAPQLSPATRVLDVGCGNGGFLLELCACFGSGLGIDNDPEHLQMAQEAKRAADVNNVEFLLLDYPDEIAQLEPASFDMVVSLRGPLADKVQNVQAAHRLLRPDGLLYCETIAELHQKEKRAVFEPDSLQARTPEVNRVKLLLEQNGFDVRLAADVFTKWIYPDLYAWLQLECNIRAWLGIPLPEADDPRIAQFAAQNTIATGEIGTTHHVALVAGVKRERVIDEYVLGRRM
jgi:SAM-dependent methyltransferase